MRFIHSLLLILSCAIQINKIRQHPLQTSGSLNAVILLLVFLTRSSGEVFSSRLLRAFSTRARRPDSDSRRLTTLSRSPINILNLSNSFDLQTSFTMASTSSPSILFAWMSSRSVSRASLRTCSFLLMLSISSCCGK